MWSKWPCVVSTRRTPVAREHLEQQLVLVRGVDEDGVAGRLAAQHEDVVLVRTDDDLVDADVGRVVVRRARHHGEGTGAAREWSVVAGPANRAGAGAPVVPAGGGGAAAWKLDRSVK